MNLKSASLLALESTHFPEPVVVDLQRGQGALAETSARIEDPGNGDILNAHSIFRTILLRH